MQEPHDFDNLCKKLCVIKNFLKSPNLVTLNYLPTYLGRFFTFVSTLLLFPFIAIVFVKRKRERQRERDRERETERERERERKFC